MDLTDLKRWQWAVLGVLGGLAVGYARTQMDPSPNARTLSRERFENELFANPIEGKIPRIDDIVVYPPVEGVYTLNFTWYVPSEDGKGWTPQPWSLTVKGNYAGTNENIVDWLARQKKDFPQIHYSYRWYDIAPTAYYIWSGVGLVLVGGVWPSLIGLMTGAGLVPKREKKVAAYDLDRFSAGNTGGSGAEESSAVPALTDEQLAERQSQLDDMVDRMEERVADLRMTGTPAAGANASGGSSTAGTKPIQILSDKPLEVAAGPAQPEEKKEYAGEFYPTVRVHKKDDEGGAAGGAGH